MLPHILNRIFQFAVVGAIGMGVAGAIEGALTGALFQRCLQHPHFGSLLWVLGRGFHGAREAAGIGWVAGSLLGFTAFGMIAPFHPTRDPVSVLRQLLKFGITGTIAGVLLGAASGAIFGAAITWALIEQGIAIETTLWPISNPPAPPAVMLSEGALFGYVWSVFLGFIGGLGCGLSVGVRRIRQMA